MTQFNQILTSLSIEEHLLTLLILLPLVITLVAIARYVIGLKTLGVYAPIVLTLMFYEFGYNQDTLLSEPFQGLRYGLVLIIVLILSTVLSYYSIRQTTLHYYSKLAIVQTSVVLSLIALLMFAAAINKQGILQVNLFSLIFMATLTERFMHIFAFNKKVKEAIKLSFETVIVGVLVYVIISLPLIQNFLLTYPLILLVFYPLNLIIGKFAGLRLREYYRFNEILKAEDNK